MDSDCVKIKPNGGFRAQNRGSTQKDESEGWKYHQ